jgi:hypothetical protein
VYPVLPDLEQALVDFLTDHPTLAPLHGGRVGTELRTDQTCLQVTALGGAQPWPWEATPEFQIAAWGGTKIAANTLSRTVTAVAYELAGAAITGGRVVGVAVRLASLWAPDETTGRVRYRTDLAFTLMP